MKLVEGVPFFNVAERMCWNAYFKSYGESGIPVRDHTLWGEMAVLLSDDQFLPPQEFVMAHNEQFAGVPHMQVDLSYFG